MYTLTLNHEQMLVILDALANQSSIYHGYGRLAGRVYLRRDLVKSKTAADPHETYKTVGQQLWEQGWWRDEH